MRSPHPYAREVVYFYAYGWACSQLCKRGLPMPAFGFVVNCRNEILLIQRGYGSNKGKWSLPGGRRDPGEILQKTAVRETREETGIRMSAEELYYKSNQHRFEIWRGKQIGGHLRVQRKECLDAKWFPKDMLPHDDCLAFGPDRRALAKWVSQNPGSRRVYYPRAKMRRSGFSLLVNYRNEVLLIQRKSGKREGKWSIPGGTAGRGRSRRNAAIEETMQLTGILVTPTQLYYRNRHRAKVWLCKFLSSQQMQNGRWFPLNDLPDDESLGFAVDVRTIEKWASDNHGSRRVNSS